jgi:hypothetical protein
MRGFLIFLAFAFPVVLASPFFWSLVSMEFGAERVGYVHGDVTQWATLGPQAPWPRWALVPEGATLTVRANFEAAPGYNATGYGDIAARSPAPLIARRYEAALRRAGWTVRVGRFDAILPDIPPRPIRRCIVEGRRGGRVQRLSVDIGDGGAVGALHWTEGEMLFPIGATPRDCWAGVS